jgi:hypothetical protein
MQKAVFVVLAFAAVGFLFGLLTGSGALLAWSLVAAFGVAGLDGILTALNERASLPVRVFGGAGFLVMAVLAYFALDYARLIERVT